MRTRQNSGKEKARVRPIWTAGPAGKRNEEGNHGHKITVKGKEKPRLPVGRLRKWEGKSSPWGTGPKDKRR